LADDRVVGHTPLAGQGDEALELGLEADGHRAADSPRSKPSSVMATAQPLLTPPTTSSFGHVASVK
jgi:hypothetical protein